MINKITTDLILVSTQHKEHATNDTSMNVETPTSVNEDESTNNANLSNRIKALLSSSKELFLMKVNPETLKYILTLKIVEVPQSNNVNTFITFDAFVL